MCDTGTGIMQQGYGPNCGDSKNCNGNSNTTFVPNDAGGSYKHEHKNPGSHCNAQKSKNAPRSSAAVASKASARRPKYQAYVSTEEEEAACTISEAEYQKYLAPSKARGRK